MLDTGKERINDMFPGTERGLGGGMPCVSVTPRPNGTLTREQFIHAVREAIVATAPVDEGQIGRIMGAKLVYGAGDGGYRGICYYGAWNHVGEHAFVEIAATGEESAIQLAGTTVHELAHVIAGPGAGHGAEWKQACAHLGLNNAQASGHVYTLEGFRPELAALVMALGEPVDGKPTFHRGMGAVKVAPKVKPCPMGQGTRGGKSRGPGSGSRLRLHMCACPVRVRVGSDTFVATCGLCGEAFKLVTKGA